MIEYLTNHLKETGWEGMNWFHLAEGTFNDRLPRVT